MSCTSCPLSYFVAGTPRMINRGYGCGATGGKCKPNDKCEEWVKEMEKEFYE